VTVTRNYKLFGDNNGR